MHAFRFQQYVEYVQDVAAPRLYLGPQKYDEFSKLKEKLTKKKQ